MWGFRVLGMNKDLKVDRRDVKEGGEEGERGRKEGGEERKEGEARRSQREGEEERIPPWCLLFLSSSCQPSLSQHVTNLTLYLLQETS